ncbi:MAG: ABC transporter substrate-binding protein, partial [Clostridia bacterium]
ESYPPEALLLPAYDYRKDPEAVIATAPDLVLVRPMMMRVAPEYIEVLERAGLTVVSLYPETFAEFPAYIRQLAILTGTEEQAEVMLAERMEALAALQAEAETWGKRVPLFFECTADPLRTLTRDALAAETVRLAGGELIGSLEAPENPGSSMTPYPIEKLLEQGDSVAMYVAQRGGMNPSVTEEEIRARPGYQAIAAVREGHLLILEEKLISSPVFRQIEGARALQKAMKEWMIP